MEHHIPAIAALSDIDIAQLTSSRTVTSLRDVIGGLFSNSLEAKASNVRITVHHSRGNCVVEDDGIGIAASEFHEDGGLLKDYHTSKIPSIPDQGGHGLFLASLAAMALLTITSRVDSALPPNSITCNHARSISRLIPSPPQHEIALYQTGTRVTVRNLFGSMPVRVKQRARLENDNESLKDWKDLIREVLSLLLAWNAPIIVTLQDDTTQRQLRLNGQDFPKHAETIVKHPTEQTHVSAVHQRNLSYLAQAGLIATDSWHTWIPVSGTISTVSIKGAISLEPAPSKHIQFISLNARPIFRNAACNELYEEINRIFSSSRFGVEDDEDFNHEERPSRTGNKRFKRDGYTNQQLKGPRKGTDRWPMFFLQISTNASNQTSRNGERSPEQSANLRKILDVLGAVVITWLSEHHFSPAKYRRQKCASPAKETSTRTVSIPNEPGIKQAMQKTNAPASFEVLMREEHNLAMLSAEHGIVATEHNSSGGGAHVPPSLRGGRQIFSTWSRIKAGQPASAQNKGKAAGEDSGLRKTTCAIATPKPASSAVDLITAPLQDEDTIPASLDQFEICHRNVHVRQSTEAEFTPWVHPITKQTYLLNTRNGVLTEHHEFAPRDGGVTEDEVSKHFRGGRSVKLRKPDQDLPPESYSLPSPWINEILQDWQNPVFKPPEKLIPHAFEDDDTKGNKDGYECNHHDHIPKDQTRGLSTEAIEGQLDSYGLQQAIVIAQVDKKFILVKMPVKQQTNTASLSTGPSGISATILVLIDQHAADERCNVEALFENFCKIPPATPQLKSPLGYFSVVRTASLQNPILFQTSRQESELLQMHAAFFAKWGIFYNIKPATSANAIGVGPVDDDNHRGHKIVITSLPPTIMERCVASPKLIISILRSEIWSKKAKDLRQPPLPLTSIIGVEAEHVQPRNWFTHLNDCPRGIIDLLCSRACRTSIMFNDELTKQQCESLVQRLTKCKFPWQCAHGRPSAAPVIGLGSEVLAIGEGVEEDRLVGFGVPPDESCGVGSAASQGGVTRTKPGSFMRAFKAWQTGS